MSQLRYSTPHGTLVTRSSSCIPYSEGLHGLLSRLDRERGVYLSSGYEYPGRYSRWDVASVAPLIEIVGRERTLCFRSLNTRGEVFLSCIAGWLSEHPHWADFVITETELKGELNPLAAKFPEEQRSKQPSPFSILRALVQEFGTAEDSRLALVGAFGYDLLLQFDPIALRLPREDQKTLHLFLCDDIYFMDRKKEVIERFEYDFSSGSRSASVLSSGESSGYCASGGRHSVGSRTGRVPGQG